jgi:hypothetical protein
LNFTRYAGEFEGIREKLIFERTGFSIASCFLYLKISSFADKNGELETKEWG